MKHYFLDYYYYIIHTLETEKGFTGYSVAVPFVVKLSLALVSLSADEEHCCPLDVEAAILLLLFSI
jgi:hypothetical protein